ncbi:LOW QUALITY PROTEIN: hypothetical protein OSB04_022716 [Centaurea solstitialis]|uniref:WEB family protein n=1 Tax=Centaurea solstitialis TaxID=347529 RepID=A0AA38SJE9_9ASTR|nr:LOW QUALITY PROTEIN: hypothetical protein OSB04_022716 [Centaurea solstitialis]
MDEPKLPNLTTIEAIDSGQNLSPRFRESEKKDNNGGGIRGEIDTSAPFESVKEAVTRFGGVGFWKPQFKHQTSLHASEDDTEEVFDAAKAEAQAVQLANDLVLKERETLEVLKELEATKTTLEELKLKLQKESAAVELAVRNQYEEPRLGNDQNALEPQSGVCNQSDEPRVGNDENTLEPQSGVSNQFEEPRVGNDENTLEPQSGMRNQSEEPREGNDENAPVARTGGDSLMCPSSAPGFILMELKQAKLNLTRTTNDLADIRATVESYNKKIEKERSALEKTRQRLSSNPAKTPSLEEDVDLPRELHRLTSETEQFKKVGEVAKSELLRAMNQIKQTKTRLKTAEIRLIGARKLTEAAKACEALALSEIKSITKSQTLSEGEGVTLSFEEYISLKTKAREADEASNNRETEAMARVEEAEISKSKILNRVEEATEEVKSSKKVLEEALAKVEAANNDKLKAEEALRKWRSDHGQRRKSTVQNSTKFKNSSNRVGTHLGSNVSGPVLMPTMSIGQILSRKLLLTEENSERSSMKRKVSLAQMLSKPTNDGGGNGNGGGGGSGGDDGGKRRSGKRKKFGFGRISFLVAKPSKKKKKHSISSRLSCSVD